MEDIKNSADKYRDTAEEQKKNNLSILYPEIAKQWHPTKNGDLLPQQITVRNGKKVWWQCEKGHEWQAVISKRTQGIGCPYCSGRYVVLGETDLSTTHPDVSSEWHPTKNGETMPQHVLARSSKKVWWKCKKCGHEWETRIAHRCNGSGCPACYNARRTKKNEL